MEQIEYIELEKNSEVLSPPSHLLPKNYDLEPIEDENGTFSDCYFNDKFEDLSFESKLRVVCDLIRQSSLPEYYADPSTDVEELTGDCFTMSKATIQYLKYLNVGSKYEYVMVNRRPFDPIDKQYAKHAIVIVSDENGERWQVDSSTWMAYGFGTVSKEGTDEQIILDYETITDNDSLIIDKIKEMRFRIHRGDILSGDEISDYLNFISEAETGHLIGFAGEAYASLASYTGDLTMKTFYADKAIKLDPFRGGNESLIQYATSPELFYEARKLLADSVIKQCNIWQSELDELVERGCDLERQLLLSQWIVNEKQFNGLVPPEKININGRNYPLTSITPRLLMELGLNTVIIKPSAYYLGVDSTVREAIRKKGIAAKYDMDPTLPTRLSGITPLLFSHSLGDRYHRACSGRNTVLLVSDDAEDLHEIKATLRKSLGRYILNRSVIWSDGQPIDWHPYYMNYIHTTDNPPEAAMHLLMGFPELSVMNRWMYPSPTLVNKNREVKHGNQ